MQKKENKKSQDKYIGTPIKEYRLPLSDYIAYYLPFIIWFFWSAVTAMIVTPTIIKNYENFWYYLGIAPVTFFFVMGCINWVRFIHHSNRYHSVMDADGEAEDSLEIHQGAPGTCKSLTAKERVSAKGENSWKKIKYKTWKLYGKMNDPNYQLTDEDKEVLDAFEFNSKGKGVPCRLSSVPAYDKRYRRYYYKLELAHLKQEKRMAFASCLWQDEIGTSLNFSTAWNVYAKENNGEVNIDDFSRYIRHFGEFRLIGTEQDGANVAIFMKRIASDNKLFEGKEWVLKPRFLLWLFKKLEKRFTRRMLKSEAIRFGKFMDKFEKFVYKCGFFKIIFSSCGNYVTSGNQKSQVQVIVIDSKQKKFVYYMPRMSSVIYETRAMRNGYIPKNKPIDVDVWDSMTVSDEDVKKMLKSNNIFHKQKEDSSSERENKNLLQKEDKFVKKKSTDEILQF